MSIYDSTLDNAGDRMLSPNLLLPITLAYRLYRSILGAMRRTPLAAVMDLPGFPFLGNGETGLRHPTVAVLDDFCSMCASTCVGDQRGLLQWSWLAA